MATSASTDLGSSILPSVIFFLICFHHGRPMDPVDFTPSVIKTLMFRRIQSLLETKNLSSRPQLPQEIGSGWSMNFQNKAHIYVLFEIKACHSLDYYNRSSSWVLEKGIYCFGTVNIFYRILNFYKNKICIAPLVELLNFRL